VLQHSRFIAVLQIQLGWVSQITPKQFMHHWVDMCKSYHVIILSDGNIIILLYYHITILLYIIYHYIIYIYIQWPSAGKRDHFQQICGDQCYIS
jgi:hypothetical protein